MSINDQNENENFGSLKELAQDLSEEEEDQSYIIVDGVKYVRAEEKKPTALEDLEETERFRSVPLAPRKVHLSAKMNLLLRNSAASGFGALFFICALFFLIVFIKSTGFSFLLLRYDMGKWHSSDLPCKLISSDSARFKINESKVYRHRISIQKPDGRTVEFVCHSFRQLEKSALPRLWQSNSNANVYKLQGTSLNVLDPHNALFFLGFLSIFLLVGFLLAFAGVPRAIRRIALLKNGSVHKAVPIDIKDSSVRVNHRTVQKITYVFLDKDGKKQQKTANACDWEKLADEPYEILFCSRSNLKHSVLFDELPKGMKMDYSKGFTASYSFLWIAFLDLVCLAEIIVILSF
ncbi:MAG: hypothetical protein Q4G69_01340 [Planctomycetia bacterium]|nr:hypothetical protein [Planctomycetia bacterium]